MQNFCQVWSALWRARFHSGQWFHFSRTHVRIQRLRAVWHFTGTYILSSNADCWSLVITLPFLVGQSVLLLLTCSDSLMHYVAMCAGSVTSTYSRSAITEFTLCVCLCVYCVRAIKWWAINAKVEMKNLARLASCILHVCVWNIFACDTDNHFPLSLWFFSLVFPR